MMLMAYLFQQDCNLSELLCVDQHDLQLSRTVRNVQSVEFCRCHRLVLELKRPYNSPRFRHRSTPTTFIAPLEAHDMKYVESVQAARMTLLQRWSWWSLCTQSRWRWWAIVTKDCNLNYILQPSSGIGYTSREHNVSSFLEYTRNSIVRSRLDDRVF